MSKYNNMYNFQKNYNQIILLYQRNIKLSLYQILICETKTNLPDFRCSLSVQTFPARLGSGIQPRRSTSSRMSSSRSEVRSKTWHGLVTTSGSSLSAKGEKGADLDRLNLIADEQSQALKII